MMDIYSPTIIDIIDILFVAIISYQLYRTVRGTASIPIFIVISAIYLMWLLTTALKMELLSMILGQIIGIGLIAIVVVFQPEIRRFLLYIGSNYFTRFTSKDESSKSSGDLPYINSVVKACERMGKSKTGALIVFMRKHQLEVVKASGDKLDSSITSRLLETIFFKNSPLHDGALIIDGDRIVAARCLLPSTERNDVPAAFGMRHKAALGITEQSDAIVVIVSEQTGFINYAESGVLTTNLTAVMLKEKLGKAL